jgi:hypothetical protein
MLINLLRKTANGDERDLQRKRLYKMHDLSVTSVVIITRNHQLRYRKTSIAADFGMLR